MSFLVMLAPATAAAVTGINISTSFASFTARTWSLCANEMIATSRMFKRPPSGLTRLMHLGVGLTVRPEVPDALERRADLVVVDPDGLDAHADVDVFHRHLLQKVHERKVSSVEHDQRTRVREFHRLPVERHVDDAERRDRALVRQVDLVGGGNTVRRTGAPG